MRFASVSKKQPPISMRAILRKKGVLANFFRREPVSLVIVHGSVVRNQMKPLSDVDVAILFKNNNYKYADIGRIAERISTVLNREDIDLAVLNRASPLLWMQVLKKGKPVFVRNRHDWPRFRLQTIQRYLATGHLRKYFNECMERSILGKKR